MMSEVEFTWFPTFGATFAPVFALEKTGIEHLTNMGSTNSIPIVSQAKSTIQYVSGETEEALKTQEIFLHECPVVAQGTSVVQWVEGDKEGAIETQRRCGENLLRAADAIPVLGHTKGAIHYIMGDGESGARAMKSATRTTGVMAGGAAGFLLAGPPGAIIGGVGTGVEMDLITTEITGESSGYMAAIDNAIVNPNAGDLFDLMMIPISDGLVGVGGGKLASQATHGGGVGYLDSKATSVLDSVDVDVRADKLAASYSPEFTQKRLQYWQEEVMKVKRQDTANNPSIKDSCRAITGGGEDSPLMSVQEEDESGGGTGLYSIEFDERRCLVKEGPFLQNYHQMDGPFINEWENSNYDFITDKNSIQNGKYNKYT